MKLLVSYSHKDVTVARTIKRALERFEVSVLLDEHDVRIGDSISDRLSSLIWQIDYLLVLISPRSLASQWVHWELTVAHQRELEEKRSGILPVWGSRILPVLIQGESVPASLKDRVYADFRTQPSQAREFKKLVATLLEARATSGGKPFNTDLFLPNHVKEVRVPPLPELALGPHLKIVKSPMVGTAYRSASPGAKPWVDVGDTIAEGQPMMIIEAMKIMNEIESDAAGTLVEILFNNEDSVEFGQPLFAIRPDS